MLCDGGACHAVQMGGGGMPEEVGVKVFINADTICCTAKDILQGPW